MLRTAALAVAVSTIVVGSTLTFTAARAEPPARFEYLFVAATMPKDEWRIKNVNGKDVTNNGKDLGEPLYEYANTIGKEGWEMVSNAVVLSNPHMMANSQAPQFAQRMVFKRRL